MVKKFFYYQPLSRKVLVLVIVTSVLVASLITILQSGVEYWKKTRDLRLEGENVVAAIQQPLTEALQNFEYKAVEKIAESLLLRDDITLIRVTDDHGVTIQREKWAHSQEVFIKKAALVVEQGGTKKYLGSLQLRFSAQRLVSDLLSRMLIILLGNILATALVASILFFALRELLTRPVEQMVHYLKTMDLTRDDYTSLQLDRASQARDEVTQLVDCINQRDVLIREYYQILTQRLSAQTEQIDQERARSEFAARLAEVGQMAASIAHEINNPLMIIGGNVELLMDKTEPGPTYDVLQKTLKASQRITTIVKNLRIFSREGSKDPFESLAVAKLLVTTQEFCAHRLKKGNARMEIACEDPDLKIRGREAQLQQILINLVNNSVDAMENLKEKWVRLEVVRSGPNAILKVMDAGAGIPKATAERLFQPFFTTKPIGKGTGLGLSISQKIVHEHGGRIFVDHSCEHTCFVVELPVAEEAMLKAA